MLKRELYRSDMLRCALCADERTVECCVRRIAELTERLDTLDF